MNTKESVTTEKQYSKEQSTTLTLEESNKEWEKEEPEYIDSKYKEFKIVRKNKKEKYKIVYGNSQVTAKEFRTTKEANRYLEKKPYEVIICAALIAVSYNMGILNNENQ